MTTVTLDPDLSIQLLTYERADLMARIDAAIPDLRLRFLEKREVTEALEACESVRQQRRLVLDYLRLYADGEVVQ